MPTYEYECEECSACFEVIQRMKDDVLITCPDCEQEGLRRVIFAPYVFIKQDPTSVRQLADRNSSRMSNDEKSERQMEYETKKEIAAKELPQGMTRVKPGNKGEKQWYHPMQSATSKEKK